MAEVTNRPEFFAGQSNGPIASVCPMFPNVFVVSLGSTSVHSFFLSEFALQVIKKGGVE